MTRTGNKENEILFFTALCLFFPLALPFLLHAGFKRRQKALMAVGGLAVFLLLLTPALWRPPAAEVPESELIVTRTTLYVGQSGGLTVTDSTGSYYPHYEVSVDNGVLEVTGSLYTARQVGDCVLTVRFGDEERSVIIRVVPGGTLDQAVYATVAGKRYHKTKSHADENAVEMTEEEALQSGKTPCQTCYR